MTVAGERSSSIAAMAMEEDRLIVCPYNKSHHIYESRLPIHLTKCAKSRENKPICPFNSSHHVDSPEYKSHVSECPSRKVVERDAFHTNDETSNIDLCRALKQDVEPPDPRENWDDANASLGTYEADKQSAIKLVIRSPQGKTRSERKAYRFQERKRIQELQNGPCESETGTEIVLKPVCFRRLSWDESIHPSLGMGRGQSNVASL